MIGFYLAPIARRANCVRYQCPFIRCNAADWMSLYDNGSHAEDPTAKSSHLGGIVSGAELIRRGSAVLLNWSLMDNSEKKIDRIEDRLAGIENVLANLATKLNDLDLHRDPTEHSSQSRSSRKGVGRSPSTFEEAPTPAPFEGETTIRNQSGYARELLAKAVGSTPSIEQNAEVKSALAALGDLVAGNTTASTGTIMHPLINRSLADIDPAKLDKPPLEVVNEILRIACGRYTPPLSTKSDFDRSSSNVTLHCTSLPENEGTAHHCRRCIFKPGAMWSHSPYACL